MRTPALAVAALCVAALLAGCSGKGDTSGTPTGGATSRALAEGKGAIHGLVIDDVYRPVAGCLVLLQGAGLTATSDPSGEFEFLDLLPGAYVAIANCADHEAAPQDVDVVAGEYAPLEIQARRIFSQDGYVITVQYSVFISCAADFVVNFVVGDCTGDQSGDSDRAGFTTKNITGLQDVTYLVTEAKMNKVGDYSLQVREHLDPDPEGAGGDRYAVAEPKQVDYIKITNQFNVTNTEHNAQDNNVPWRGDKPWDTILFYHGPLMEEAKGADPGTGLICCGVGAEFGIKANFVQSIFLGEPKTPIERYCVLATSCG